VLVGCKTIDVQNNSLIVELFKEKGPDDY